jgi:hypothetical protein
MFFVKNVFQYSDVGRMVDFRITDGLERLTKYFDRPPADQPTLMSKILRQLASTA